MVHFIRNNPSWSRFCLSLYYDSNKSVGSIEDHIHHIHFTSPFFYKKLYWIKSRNLGRENIPKNKPCQFLTHGNQSRSQRSIQQFCICCLEIHQNEFCMLHKKRNYNKLEFLQSFFLPFFTDHN